MSMEGTEEVASLTVEVGVRYQSSSAELVLDDENDDVVLEVSCSQSQAQLLVVLNEEAVVVSSDGVNSRLAVLSSQNQSLVVIELELEKGVLDAVSSQGHAEQNWQKGATNNSNSNAQAKFIFFASSLMLVSALMKNPLLEYTAMKRALFSW